MLSGVIILTFSRIQFRDIIFKTFRDVMNPMKYDLWFKFRIRDKK